MLYGTVRKVKKPKERSDEAKEKRSALKTIDPKERPVISQ